MICFPFCDPAFLLWRGIEVRGNKGARTAGMDGQTAFTIEAEQGVEVFLDGLRSALKVAFSAQCRCGSGSRSQGERQLRRSGSRRSSRSGGPGIGEVGARADLRGDFLPCSYGFRPKRRAHDAVAEVRYLTARTYEWVVEGDISTKCRG